MSTLFPATETDYAKAEAVDADQLYEAAAQLLETTDLDHGDEALFASVLSTADFDASVAPGRLLYDLSRRLVRHAKPTGYGRFEIEVQGTTVAFSEVPVAYSYRNCSTIGSLGGTELGPDGLSDDAYHVLSFCPDAESHGARVAISMAIEAIPGAVTCEKIGYKLPRIGGVTLRAYLIPVRESTQDQVVEACQQLRFNGSLITPTVIKKSDEFRRVEILSAAPARPLDEESGKTRLVFRMTYNAHVVRALAGVSGQRLQVLPGMGGEKGWVIPPNATSVRQAAEIAAHFEFDVSSAAAEYIHQSVDKAAITYEASRAVEAEPIEGIVLPAEPRPYQSAGIRYIVAHENMILGDQMRLGKTMQVLVAAFITESWPLLVVCPASVKLTWAAEVCRWLPHLKDEITIIIGGADRKGVADLGRLRGKFSTFAYKSFDGVLHHHSIPINDVTKRIVIVNYDIIRHHFNELLRIGPERAQPAMLVFDEGHRIRRRQSKMSRAARALAKDTPRRVITTGTPVVNRPAELIHPLQVLGQMKAISPGGVMAFKRRYCGLKETKYGQDISGAENLDELGQLLRETCLLRRTMKDVSIELPDKTHTLVPLEITNSKEYEKAKRDIVAWIHSRVDQDAEFLASLTDFTEREQAEAIRQRKQTKSAAAMRAAALAKMAALRDVAIRGKAKHLFKWLHDHAEGGEKTILFSRSRWLQDELVKQFPGVSILAAHSAEKRHQACMAFQDQSRDYQHIVCSLGAASEGITLSEATNVVFCDQGWTPGEHEQAEYRAEEVGREGGLWIWTLVASNTIEEDIYELIEKKRAITTAIVDQTGEAVQYDMISVLIDRLIAKKP